MKRVAIVETVPVNRRSTARGLPSFNIFEKNQLVDV